MFGVDNFASGIGSSAADNWNRYNSAIPLTDGFFANLSDLGWSAANQYVSGLVGDYFSDKAAARSVENAQALMNYQAALNYKNNYNYAQAIAINSPSWTVQGLRKANLNPILAFGHGGSFGSSPSGAVSVSPSSAGQSQASMGTFARQERVHAALTNMAALAQIKNLNAQSAATLMNAQTNAKAQEVSATSAEFSNAKLQSEAAMISAQASLSDQELNYYMAHPDEYEDYVRAKLRDPSFRQKMEVVNSALKGVGTVGTAVGAAAGYKKVGQFLSVLKSIRSNKK